MLPRWNFAYALAAGDIGGTRVDWEQLNEAKDATRTFELTHARRPAPGDRRLIDRVAAEFEQGDDGQSAAGFLCLAAPSFQWR